MVRAWYTRESYAHGTRGTHVDETHMGQVMVTKGGVLIKTLKPGNVFGENCLIDPHTSEEPLRVHTVTGTHPCVIRLTHTCDGSSICVT